MTALRVLAKPITTAEMSATVPLVFQRFRLPTTKNAALLQGIGLGLVLYNDSYTSLSLEIWSDLSGSPSQLLRTSTTTWTKAQVDAQFPKVYKLVYMGFEFDLLPMKPGTYYHVALRATGYTGDLNSHIAWRHAYPKPQYPNGLTLANSVRYAAKSPLEAVVFEADF